MQCQNSGICFENKCFCQARFTGDLCEVQMKNPCDDNECQNESECEPYPDYRYNLNSIKYMFLVVMFVNVQKIRVV